MAAKFITFLIIGAVNLAVATALLFFLMLALNGFSERDTNYAFLFFIVGAFVITILSGILGIVWLNFLVKRNFKLFSASIISVLIFSILGAAINLALAFGGVIIAELVRTSR